MTQHIIIICIITILLWYYYTKSKDNDDKYLPVMVRQSELMHANSRLKQENKKLRMRVKYLENYKNDVSKTFKILDNELGLINDHIKYNRPTNNQSTEQDESNSFQTSVTPTILNSLLRNSQETSSLPPPQSLPSDNLFNNIFNRFLTGDMNFANQVPLDSFIQSRERPDIPEPETTEPQDSETQGIPEGQESQESQESQETQESQERLDSQESQGIPDSQEAHSQASVSFSVNYLPLNSSYRQYLIRRDNSS
jgi:hypothetical protein